MGDTSFLVARLSNAGHSSEPEVSTTILAVGSHRMLRAKTSIMSNKARRYMFLVSDISSNKIHLAWRSSRNAFDRGCGDLDTQQVLQLWRRGRTRKHI